MAPLFNVVTGNANVVAGGYYFVNACNSVNFFLPDGNTVVTGASILMVQNGTGCSIPSQYRYNVLSQHSPIMGKYFNIPFVGYWGATMQSPAYAVWTGNNWALTATDV